MGQESAGRYIPEGENTARRSPSLLQGHLLPPQEAEAVVRHRASPLEFLANPQHYFHGQTGVDSLTINGRQALQGLIIGDEWSCVQFTFRHPIQTLNVLLMGIGDGSRQTDFLEIDEIL